MSTTLPLKEGNPAYYIVTDHPAYSHSAHVDDYGVFGERDIAEEIAAAWNAYYRNEPNPYPFYVIEVRLLPKRKREWEDGGLFHA